MTVPLNRAKPQLTRTTPEYHARVVCGYMDQDLIVPQVAKLYVEMFSSIFKYNVIKNMLNECL